MTDKSKYGDHEFSRLLKECKTPENIYQLGTELRECDKSGENHGHMLRCFKKAAELGHPGAQNDLGTMLREGFGCNSDISAAINWYEQAAEQGEAMANYNLGTIYLHGVGDRLDHTLAEKYLTLAAEGGLPDACSDLGTMYRFGDGVEQNYALAAELHLLAAMEGDLVAMASLCDYYKELVRPAMSGNLMAARALHFVYSRGYADDTDPAIGWAWIRWAHDVCLTLLSLNPFHPKKVKTHEEYQRALNSLEADIRAEGDLYLFEILDIHQCNIESKWQQILTCGAEGGLVGLIGRWGLWGWEFVCHTDDASLSLLCDEAEPVKQISKSTLDWFAAIDLIDKYPWHKLHPLYVHPEFGKRVFDCYRERTAVDGQDESNEENWRLLCYEP